MLARGGLGCITDSFVKCSYEQPLADKPGRMDWMRPPLASPTPFGQEGLSDTFGD